MAALRLFARFGYVPTMLIGLNLLAVYLMADGYSVLWIGPLFGFAVTLSLLTERILPFEHSWNDAHSDVVKDVAHGVFYEIANINAIMMLPLVRCLSRGKGSGLRLCHSACSCFLRSSLPILA